MKLEREKFRLWLLAQPAEKRLGVSGDCCNCPLTNFYREASGGHEITIADKDGAYYISRGYHRSRLAPWAEDFASGIDRTDLAFYKAADALRVLDGIPK